MTRPVEAQLLLQYPIPLPTDYDMDIIRERVRTRGGALDDRAGLIVKAYCIRQAGVDGAATNAYAPFYLWGDARAAADFLWHGTGFHGIVRDFGRPQARTWIPEAGRRGPVPAGEVRHAAVRTTTVPADGDLVETARVLAAATVRRSRDPRVHVAAAGIDPASWQAVEVWTSAEPAQDLAETGSYGTTVNWSSPTGYTVLHVSEPTR